jgi:hypothetical protein
MAGIASRKIVLYDKWPGQPNQNLGIPTGGFASTELHDVTNPGYPVGEKISIRTDFSSVKGNSTLTYLQYFCMSGENPVEDLSTGWPVFQQACNSTCADGTNAAYTCTNAGSFYASGTGYACGTAIGTVAIPCGTLSYRALAEVTTGGANTGGYGWFWTGGVCPVGDVTFFDTDELSCISTDGNVTAGFPIRAVVDTSVLVIGYAEVSEGIFGYALEDDA